MDADGITRVALFNCPRCGHRMDAFGSSTGEHAAPRVGDVNACMYCGCAMVFIDALGTGALQVRPMTDKEIAALSEDERRELARIRSFVREVMRPEQAKQN
jgi:hypothetical protein